MGFFQALGLVAYCGLVATVMWNASQLFKDTPDYFGPFLFLILFSTSALICSLITLGYPFTLYFNKGKKKEAIKLVFYTTYWLVFLSAIVIFYISNN